MDRGYCLMIGGDEAAGRRLDPIFAALAPGIQTAPRTPGREKMIGIAEHGYAGYRKEPNVAKNSDVETFCALRLFIDSWRWDGVPWYLRSGKCLAETAHEVLVELKPPPQELFADAAPASGRANYLRFRLSPSFAVALAARVKRAGTEFVGDQRELHLVEEQPGEESPYERLLGDAMAGDGSLFTREEAVEAAWAVVEPVLNTHYRTRPYEHGT